MLLKRLFQRKGKKGSVHKAVVVSEERIHTEDGSKVKFDNNAAVLVDDKGEPVGTRIFGQVTRELRSRGQMKILGTGFINDQKRFKSSNFIR